MSTIAIVVLVLLVIPVICFVAWQILDEARVRIDSGTIGLVIARGAATERALEPGVHYIWPYRQQLVQRYPLRELTYLTVNDDETQEPSDFTDHPLHLHLGDRTAATVRYTIRFRVRPDDLRAIHERVGPDGIKSAVRDRSRQVLIDTFVEPDLDYLDAFAERRTALQARAGTALEAALLGDGFDVTLFSLRDVDLGEVGEMLQDAVRRQAELDREAAAAAVRRARVRSDADANAEIVAGLTDEVLRYRQIELGRETVEKWDGHGPLPGSVGAIAAPAAPEPAARRRRLGGRRAVSRMATMSQGETGKPAKRDYWFEMIAVILLGIATIGSAWCGYQASTWNGEESRQARNATDYRVEASRLFALGTQKVSYDANIGAQYADAYVSKKPGLQQFIKGVLARKEFRPVLDQWDAKAAAGETSFGSLFDDKAYMAAQFGGYQKADQANAATRLSAEAADTGDDYILTTLLMAAALFFAGVATSFGSRSARVVLVAGAALVLALAAARLIDLPVS